MKGVTAPVMLLISLVFALAILWMVGGFAQISKGINIPGTDYFAQIGRLFGLVEEKTGLFGQRTHDFVCGGDLKRFESRCNIPRDKVAEVCKGTPEDIEAYCQVPPDYMKLFCGLGFKDQDTLCHSQKQFYDSCAQSIPLLKANPMWGITNLPFCK